MIKSVKSVGKKEARAFIQRLKIFSHVMLKTVNNLKPIEELVSLCHEQLSHNESLLFQNQASAADPFASTAY